MAPQPCQLMKEKRVSESSMVWLYYLTKTSCIIDNIQSCTALCSFYWELISTIVMYAAIIYPSLLQLERGVTDSEDKGQKAVCMERYKRRDDEECRQPSDIDIEREEECGICMETSSKIVLPKCYHAMCLKCYREW